MAANETKLGALHDQLATVMAKALEGETSSYEDDEGATQTVTIPPSAAIMQVAAKFLKDNNITCTPSSDNAMGELEEKMRQQRERRARVTPTDLRAATDQTDFLKGLN